MIWTLVNFPFLFYKHKSYIPFDLTTFDQHPKSRNIEGRKISEEWIKTAETEVAVVYFTAVVLSLYVYHNKVPEGNGRSGP
jgi:hypothetical protein